MRKFSAGFILLTFLGISLPQVGDFMVVPALAQEPAAEAATKEDAELLYGEALDFKKKGNLPQAIDSYARAMRIDRSILAFDDNGLIEALKNDCIEKLKKTPDDVKLLETLGFVHAVCFSDYNEAIACYEKVFNLVTEEKVKERTASLIDRLRESASVQDNFHAEVSSQLRDERLKSWSELERSDRFGADASIMQAKSERLAESYKAKDSLKNKVPQLEKELKDMQEEYDKANRLFYTVSDKDLYERRRRRLKDQIAEKEQEVAAARTELEEAEDTAKALESELAAAQKEKDESPIRSYDDSSNKENPDGSDTGTNGSDAGAPSDENDTGNPADQPETGSEEPLPAVDNPDFPDQIPDQQPASVTTDKIEELINDL